MVWLQPEGPETWHLGMLSVRPDIQDRKLGRRLLGDAEAFAVARGARRIRMEVVGIRDALIGWYERRGYRLTERAREKLSRTPISASGSQARRPWTS